MFRVGYVGDQVVDRVGARNLDWFAVLGLGVIAAVVFLVLATFRDYGISWDEMVQDVYGKKLLAYYASGFQNTSAFYYSNLYLYGGLFDIVAAIANYLSPFGEFETRHLLGGLAFAAGLFGAWKLADLLGGKRAALITVLCLAADPTLYGHSFINPKDSPLAWLLVWVIYFGCRLLERPSRPKISTLIGFAVSIGLAMGTRIIAVAFVALFGAVFVLSLSPRVLAHSKPAMMLASARRSVGPLLAVMPLAFLLMALFWPWSVLSDHNVIDALETFSHFGWHPLVLWNGDQISSTDLPAGYLLRLLFFKLPEYVLVGITLAAVFGAVALREGRAVLRKPRFTQYLFILVCVAMPILGFIAMRPVVYNGLRHFLFVVPPLVILAALALDRAIGLALARSRAAGIALAMCLGLAMAWQVARLVKVHPYEYLSYNSLIGGIPGAETRYELDYWGTSLGEAAKGFAAWAARNRIQHPTVFVCGDRESAEYFLPKNIAITDKLSLADFYIGINNPPCGDHFDNPKKAVFSVKREGVTLSYVLDLRTNEKVQDQ